ncbi:MAG: glycosyltransferase family 2 protein [Candidatus Shapirobacteria bacterium]
MKPVLSIIILNYNTKNILKDCLASLVRFDKRLDFSGKIIKSNQEEITPAEIIVVDNGSCDGSREFLKNWEKKKSGFGAIFNKKNLGFGKANNLAMKKARGEYFLLLNSDTLFFQAAISQTLFWLCARPEFDLAAPRLLNQNKTIQPSAGRFPNLVNTFAMLFLDRLSKKQILMSSPDQIKEVDWVMGAFMMLKKKVFTKTKGFDEKIFMYMEEVEWCYRIKKADFKIGFYPSAQVIHLKGASSASRTIPILNIYKGLIYFYQKHYSKVSYYILKLLLRVKAGLALILGILTKNEYIKKTYRQAWAIN